MQSRSVNESADSRRIDDAVAFETLYDRHVSFVLGIACRMTSDSATAEDVAQTVFVELWRARAEVAPANVVRWLSRRTRIEALVRLRRREITPETFDPLVPENGRGASPPDRAAVAAALSALDRSEREAIESGFFSGSTCEEIGVELGLPPQAIKRYIRSGLTGLHRLLYPRDVSRDSSS